MAAVDGRPATLVIFTFFVHYFTKYQQAAGPPQQQQQLLLPICKAYMLMPCLRIEFPSWKKKKKKKKLVAISLDSGVFKATRTRSSI
jgi:hypothetical protein